MIWKYMTQTESDVNVKQVDSKVVGVRSGLGYENLSYQHDILIQQLSYFCHFDYKNFAMAIVGAGAFSTPYILQFPVFFAKTIQYKRQLFYCLESKFCNTTVTAAS